MAKLTLNDVTSGNAAATRINANNDLIETAFENTLSRDGSSPNTMSADLDMNSNRVVNLAAPVNNNDAVRWIDLTGSVQLTGVAIPSQTSNSGKVIRTDGTNISWQTVISSVTAAEIGAKIYPQTTAESSASVTPSNTQIPDHTKLGYVLASRYGFDTAASGSTNYTALVNAHAVAVAAGCGMKTPTGTFTYTPTAAINLAVNWENDGLTTLNCAMSAYSGVVFQQIQSTKIKNLYGNRTGTLQGTFLRQSPVVTTDFTGYQVLDRVWAIGFARNLQIDNVFFNSYKDCRFSSGTTGIYCVPSSNVNELVFINCEALSNAQNHLFTSTLQSRGITFINCGFEGPTTTGSTFTRCREMNFIGCYAENSSTIKALILNDCSASADRLYLNGTAGVLLGTNTEMSFKGVRFTSATDVLTGGDGTQTVSMEDCQWPSSGNSISFLRFSRTNTNINNVWYGTGTGSFTGTLTGCTTSPTASISYAVHNDTVTAFIPATTATSNSTACTITGIPAAIRPLTNQCLPTHLITNNTANSSGTVFVLTTGVITFAIGADANGFTAAGTKGVGYPMILTWKIV